MSINQAFEKYAVYGYDNYKITEINDCYCIQLSIIDALET